MSQELCNHATGSGRQYLTPPQQHQAGVLVERMAENRTSHTDSKEENQVLHNNLCGGRTKPKAACMDQLWRTMSWCEYDGSPGACLAQQRGHM